MKAVDDHGVHRIGLAGQFVEAIVVGIRLLDRRHDAFLEIRVIFRLHVADSRTVMAVAYDLADLVPLLVGPLP